MEERIITIEEIARDIANSNYHFYHEVISARELYGHVDVNMSSAYTEMIKQAAKCNRFSSDVLIDISMINDRLDNFDITNEDYFYPFVIGFRKDGVDGNSFVLPRVQEASKKWRHAIIFPNDYFAVFVVQFIKDEEYGNIGFFNIVVTGQYK